MRVRGGREHALICYVAAIIGSRCGASHGGLIVIVIVVACSIGVVAECCGFMSSLVIIAG
jgi:hypothetical protein